MSGAASNRGAGRAHRRRAGLCRTPLENTSEARSGVSLIWLGPGACVIKSQEYARLMGREVSNAMMEEAYAWTVPDT